MTVPNASSIEPAKRLGRDRCPDQQLQGIDVLRDRGPLAREIGLRLGLDLLGLAQVGARRDPAFEPDPREPHALLGAGRGFLRDSSRLRSAAWSSHALAMSETSVSRVARAPASVAR